MGTQNGSKNEIWHEKILIHALELKLQPFKVYPYVCIYREAMCLQCFEAWCVLFRKSLGQYMHRLATMQLVLYPETC